MNRIHVAIISFAVILSHTVTATAQGQESHNTYIVQCMNELGFNWWDLPDMDCNDGVLFDIGFEPGENVENDPDTNDVLLSVRVNDQVNATAVCRWLTNDNGDRVTPPATFGTAVSGVELLIHNRYNGATCFFAAKGGSSASPPGDVDPYIVSPSNWFLAPIPPDEYWEAPSYVDTHARCVNCHTAGPYVASPLIAKHLGRFGLLNNGHSTFGLDPIANPDTYHVVSTTSFDDWDGIIRAHNDRGGCAEGCHAISNYTLLVPDVLARHIRTDGNNNAKESVYNSIGRLGLMPGGTQRLGDDYRWMNLDITTGTGDWESYDQLWRFMPAMTADCVVPAAMEARVVGSPFTLRTDTFDNFLEYFNPVDGLGCSIWDQGPGGCADYEVQSRCASRPWPNPNDANYPWQSVDNNPSDGDWEPVPYPTLPPPPGESCVIELRARPKAEPARIGYALPDRLYEFTPNGFACRNADQADGQCENYTVRYLCPEPGEDPGSIVQIRNDASWNSYLTTSRPLDANGEQEDPNGVRFAKGQGRDESWASQDWVIEPVWPTQYVRVRNVWKRTYLNVSQDVEVHEVTSEPLNMQWWAEQWAMERDPYYTNRVRFRNRWTGRYLTLNNTDDFSPVYAQSLNTGWNTQWWWIEE